MFQSGAFQSNAFQIGGGVRITPPVTPSFAVGGWDLPQGRRRTKKELQEEREKWGILPKKAKTLIKRVAAQQVQEPEPDNIEVLIQAFERASLAYEAQYAMLLRQEMARIREDELEEEEVLMLLLH